MNQLKKPSNVNGWLIIDKPNGIGSTDIVNEVKKKLGLKKVGHGGTLDPEATGILPIAIGEATKTIRFIDNGLKTYQFVLRLGISTDTDDSSGNIIQQSEKRPSTKDIEEALKSFQGEILQLPPKLSAIKVNGRRAYDLFRQGLKFELSPRKIFIKNLKIIERKNEEIVILKMICGKGSYVRSLARDLGNNLGCFAHAKNIRRLEYEPFKITKSISFKKFNTLTKNEVENHLIPINFSLNNHPSFECNFEDLKIILNGNPIKISKTFKKTYDIAWVHYKNVPLAIGKIENYIFHPSRVLNIYNI